jgi:hypothetical protein
LVLEFEAFLKVHYQFEQNLATLKIQNKLLFLAGHMLLQFIIIK